MMRASVAVCSKLPFRKLAYSYAINVPQVSSSATAHVSSIILINFLLSGCDTSAPGCSDHLRRTQQLGAERESGCRGRVQVDAQADALVLFDELNHAALIKEHVGIAHCQRRAIVE